jgi:maltose alpha-D-glucosyltransferase/alpha-amylase
MISRDPLWFKDAVIYEVHVKTFADSNSDGIGDFRGLIQKLDYLENLGITAIWLLPFYPSPLRDDGYDIADYFNVNPTYGTLEDFDELLAEAHRRGLRVITELVLNHTSDQNAWFQASRRAAPGDPMRDFYVWSDTPDRYADARIIFKDFEPSNWSWDRVAKAYFWHRFYSHQPDLNFDNPAVHEALFRVIDFWLERGVDGLRLDAVPYLYEREGTNCENLPETHAFLRRLRAHIDSKFEDRMLLAEANQWPEDAAAYFGAGDSCHMNFHFPLMPRMFMALQMEDRFPLIDILDQTPAIPENCQWATFLRNHDELTLEMVTDEERDYMYRVYAVDARARINLGIRRRLAPLLGNSRRKIELINILLFSLPGTPIIYYGDEIGMGDNFYLGDRDGVRTPMQWSPDRNAGFSIANPQQLYLPAVIDPEYHFEGLNVENQEKNLSSLLWWMRRVVSMRKRYKAFGRGTIEFMHPDNGKVLTFIRKYQDEIILVVVNLSRFSQVVEIDLSSYAGMTPVELFSQNKFPLIRTTPYIFTLGPHDHYWLRLEKEHEVAAQVGYRIPEFTRSIAWETAPAEEDADFLVSQVLPSYIRSCRWFGGKAQAVRDFEIVQMIPVPVVSGQAPCMLWIRANYINAPAEIYLLPLQIGAPDPAAGDAQPGVIAKFANAVLFDAVYDDKFRAALLKLMLSGKPLKTAGGELHGFSGPALAPFTDGNVSLASQVLKVEQSNTSIVYDNKLFLKLYRKLEEGVNPDSEITRHLSEKQQFPHVPPFGGSLEFRRGRNETRILGLLLGLVPNEGDAWAYTLDAVGRYFERVLAEKPAAPAAAESLFSTNPPVPDTVDALIGGVYPERARQLGQLTGEMHKALAAETTDGNFAPEPFTALYQRSVYQSMRASVRKMIQLLQRHVGSIANPEDKSRALDLIAAEKLILDRQARILKSRMRASKIRIHGDYHLGQVLNTGKGFVVIDFEGEPSRPLSERKLKRSPLRDVAGMMRSFHYAGHTALSQQATIREEDARGLQSWAEVWSARISRIYLAAYLEATAGTTFLPDQPDDLRILLDAYLLDKAVYEVGYELNNRPAWVGIPIRGIQSILNS